METTKTEKRIIEIVVAVLSVLLLAVVAVIKLTNKDIYGVNATLFQTLRMAFYAVGVLLAVVGLGAFIAAGLKGKASKDSLFYGLLALACLCMVFVQGFSIAGEFENQGKTLQDAMYAVVYLMLAAILYVMCAMESPKRIFRIIVIVAGLLLFIAATATDYGYLMEKAGRITGETESIVSFALYADEIAVLLAGLAAVIHEISGFAKAKKNKKTAGSEVTEGGEK